MKALTTLLVWMLLITAAEGEAKAKRRRYNIPLMPQKRVLWQERSVSRAKSTRVKARYTAPSRPSRVRRSSFGLQLGILTQRSSSTLGLNAHMGMRFLLALPVSDRFTVEPILGFYYDRSSVAAVSFSKQWFETGGNLLYILRSRNGKTQYRLGAAGRFDLLWNHVSASGTGSGTGNSGNLQWGVRVGPTAGLTTMLNRTTQLITNLECTFDVMKNFRPHPGFYLGLGFPL